MIVLFGRFIFKYCIGVKVNDFYSLTLGIYLMSLIGITVYWVQKYKDMSQDEAQQFKKEKTTTVNDPQEKGNFVLIFVFL